MEKKFEWGNVTYIDVSESNYEYMETTNLQKIGLEARNKKSDIRLLIGRDASKAVKLNDLVLPQTITGKVIKELEEKISNYMCRDCYELLNKQVKELVRYKKEGKTDCKVCNDKRIEKKQIEKDAVTFETKIVLNGLEEEKIKSKVKSVEIIEGEIEEVKGRLPRIKMQVSFECGAKLERVMKSDITVELIKLKERMKEDFEAFSTPIQIIKQGKKEILLELTIKTKKEERIHFEWQEKEEKREEKNESKTEKIDFGISEKNLKVMMRLKEEIKRNGIKKELMLKTSVSVNKANNPFFALTVYKEEKPLFSFGWYPKEVVGHKNSTYELMCIEAAIELFKEVVYLFKTEALLQYGERETNSGTKIKVEKIKKEENKESNKVAALRETKFIFYKEGAVLATEIGLIPKKEKKSIQTVKKQTSKEKPYTSSLYTIKNVPENLIEADILVRAGFNTVKEKRVGILVLESRKQTLYDLKRIGSTVEKDNEYKEQLQITLENKICKECYKKTSEMLKKHVNIEQYASIKTCKICSSLEEREKEKQKYTIKHEEDGQTITLTKYIKLGKVENAEWTKALGVSVIKTDKIQNKMVRFKMKRARPITKNLHQYEAYEIERLMSKNRVEEVFAVIENQEKTEKGVKITLKITVYEGKANYFESEIKKKNEAVEKLEVHHIKIKQLREALKKLDNKRNITMKIFIHKMEDRKPFFSYVIYHKNKEILGYAWEGVDTVIEQNISRLEEFCIREMMRQFKDSIGAYYTEDQTALFRLEASMMPVRYLEAVNNETARKIAIERKMGYYFFDEELKNKLTTEEVEKSI